MCIYGEIIRAKVERQATASETMAANAHLVRFVDQKSVEMVKIRCHANISTNNVSHIVSSAAIESEQVISNIDLVPGDLCMMDITVLICIP